MRLGGTDWVSRRQGTRRRPVDRYRLADHRHAWLALRHPDWTPTIADLLTGQGYMMAQFGKNHLGDQDRHLPTAHGSGAAFGAG